MDPKIKINNIPSVKAGIKRPRWSVMIPTFNPEKELLLEAINSVISQYSDFENMQIEIVDDCSTDIDVKKIIEEIANPNLSFYKQPVNLGHSKNYTSCINRAKGELIHFLHQDDKVLPGFYKKFEQMFDEYKDIGAAYCRQAYIDDDGKLIANSYLDRESTGILDDALTLLAERQRIQHCSIVVKRSVYETLGGFLERNIGCEDWEMWVRIAAKYPVAYEPEALAEYRIHRYSMSSKNMRTGKDMRDLKEAVDIFIEYLPEDKRNEVKLKALNHYADYSFGNAAKFHAEFKDDEAAAAQLNESVKLDSEYVYKHVDFLKEIKAPVESTGVSVIINTENNEDIIERTLRHLIIQRVPDYIPWEIILIDNGSNDNTIAVAEATWKKYNGKTSFRIISIDHTSLMNARNKAIDETSHNFILFCEPGNFFDKYYVKMASVNLLRDRHLGAIGGYSEPYLKRKAPKWFYDWSKQCYRIGEQFDYTNRVTWTRGYVWNSGMAIRKEAWKDIYEKNFRSAYDSDENRIAEFGIDKEFGYALRLSGWHLWYSSDLRMKQYISDSELEWKHLRNIWKQSGVNSARLKPYLQNHKVEVSDYNKLYKKSGRLHSINKTFRSLKKYKDWKKQAYASTLENDYDILKIEFYFGKLKEQLSEIRSYNLKLKFLKRIARKKDLKFLKYIITKPYFRFPQYRNSKDRRGISVVLNYNNSSYLQLINSVEKISTQKLPDGFKWEVILMTNFLRDEIRNKIYDLWKISDCSASLKISEQPTLHSNAMKISALNRSRYEYLIFINEFDLLNDDYVRMAFKLMNKNSDAGLIGGQTVMVSDVKPPSWFKNYQKSFGIGKPVNTDEGSANGNLHLWKSGLVARKKALKNVYEAFNKYSEVKNNFNGYELPHESQLSSKIILSGKKIIYDERLKLGRFIPANKFNWEYLRKLYFNKGTEEVHESAYSQLLNERTPDSGGNSWLLEANKTLLELKKYPLKKIFSKENEYKGDSEILEVEKLQGKFKEILKSKNKIYEEVNFIKKNFPVNGSGGLLKLSNGKHEPDEKIKGVSIVICCYNSSKVLPATLRKIISQKVSPGIPWELIIVDNASTDNTSHTAALVWKDHNCQASFKIVSEAEPGLSAARLKGFHTAKFEYIVLCDDDNLLENDFVENVYDKMSSDDKIGVLGGQSKGEFEKLPMEWFDDWRGSFAIGKQSDKAGDITLSKGFVWGAGMVVRKEAWGKILSNGFRSLLTDRKGNVLSAGGDTELCFALRKDGWKIYYDPKLKFKHYITAERLEWNYLRKLFRGFGQASHGLDLYRRDFKRKTSGGKDKYRARTLREEIHKTISILNKKKYLELYKKNKSEGNPDIPMIEYCLGRLESLVKSPGTYNRGVRALKRAASKSDLENLRLLFGNLKKYPRYHFRKKLNGVSIVICTFNGEERLPETIKFAALQKVHPDILWEVILVDNASTDNTKQAVIDEWKKHKTSAKLHITDEFTQGLSAARQKGFEVSKYEYIVLCDDDNLLDENFVQTTYDVMSSNDKIGVLGGPNEARCELDPPVWFKWFQQGYAAGVQADLVTGKISEGNITWRRGFVWGAGMIIRRKALTELYSKGFTSLMSDRKGYQLSSGGDSELCFALVLSGWEVWYDTRLKLLHCMPAGRIEWHYLIRLFQAFGITSVGLDLYEKSIKLGRVDVNSEELKKQNWKYEYKKTLKDVRKYGIKKILALRLSQDNNTQIPMLEYYLARLIELRRVRYEYDDNFEQLQKAAWKKNYSELRTSHRNFIENDIDFRYGWPWIDKPVESNNTDVPKISILSPSFNSQNTIEKAILSVLNQGYTNFEHIICDGGSKDGTVEIIKKYPHIKWVSEKDNGQCDAMNKAFAMSTGEVISYLNVDDYYQRGAFNKIADAFRKNPDAEMVVGNLYFEEEGYTFLRKPETDYRKIMLPFRYLFPINPVSYFYKRTVQEQAGPFPLDNHYTMDYWFLLKAYQKHKIAKIEDYLGTFVMNGFNKTSGADNRKNTHYRVLEHCWKYDKKNLPYYLYNYYKFFYYDRQPYNLKRIYNNLKKNTRRIVSILTLKKNRYYSNRLYESARSHYYLKSRLKANAHLAASFLIYPKALFNKSRQSLFAYSLLGQKYSEKSKAAYFFLTTPPGLPLANKLHYYGNEFKKKSKPLKGNSLLMLTYLISPKFIFKKKKAYKEKGTFSLRKSLSSINPLSISKNVYNYFKYREYKFTSRRYFFKAKQKSYYKKNLQALYYLTASVLVHPVSAGKKSRATLLFNTALGNTVLEKLKFSYHLYRDNPEYSFPHKLNYYGNSLRKTRQSFKGNAILFFTYIIAPKYITKREKIVKSKIIFVSQYKLPKKKFSLNPKLRVKQAIWKVRSYRNSRQPLRKIVKNTYLMSGYKIKSVYHYFRYRKFKANSKELYGKAQENFRNNRRATTVALVVRSYILYPPSILSRNKMSLIVNSVKGKSGKSKPEGG